MNKKAMLITSALLCTVICGLIIGFSLAWFSIDIRSGTDSLTFNISSDIEMVVAFAPDDLKINLTPAKANKGAVAAGLTIGEGADVLTTNQDKYIDEPATIGVARASMLYLGSSGGVSSNYRMKVSCGMYTGETGGVNISSDVLYMVFACGTGFKMDDEWLLGNIENSNVREINSQYRTRIDEEIYDEQSKQFVSYNFQNDINDNAYYLLDTNIKSPSLLKEFGIEGVWNNGELAQSSYTIVEDKMNFQFLVIAWYNRVDELLDPEIQASDTIVISLGISKDGGN